MARSGSHRCYQGVSGFYVPLEPKSVARAERARDASRRSHSGRIEHPSPTNRASVRSIGQHKDLTQSEKAIIPAEHAAGRNRGHDPVCLLLVWRCVASDHSVRYALPSRPNAARFGEARDVEWVVAPGRQGRPDVWAVRCHACSSTTVCGSLRCSGREDRRAAASRAAGADVMWGDLLESGDVYRLVGHRPSLPALSKLLDGLATLPDCPTTRWRAYQANGASLPTHWGLASPSCSWREGPSTIP